MDALEAPTEFLSTAETLDTVASIVFRHGKKVTLGLRLQDLALAFIDPLRHALRVTGLLNGLATFTPIRLPLVANGPTAIRVAVVFTGTGAKVEWSDTTDNARHDADPFGDEGRQG